MEAWPETRETLLARIRDPKDQRAWDEFAKLYEPLIYRVARKRGAQDSDAKDIAQRVLLTVASASQEKNFSGSEGHFRAWLHRVTTNATINLLQREAKHWGSGNSDIRALLEQQPANAEVSQIWETERRLQLFRYAASVVQKRFDPGNWQCFWRTTVQNQSAQLVSQELGKSIGTIYVAKSRIMASIRDLVEAIEREESSCGGNRKVFSAQVDPTRENGEQA
ncbi:MAG: sigma-70 family RNA polymerase sigma factor [Planctomycetota bacterium]